MEFSMFILDIFIIQNNLFYIIKNIDNISRD